MQESIKTLDSREPKDDVLRAVLDDHKSIIVNIKDQVGKEDATTDIFRGKNHNQNHVGKHINTP